MRCPTSRSLRLNAALAGRRPARRVWPGLALAGTALALAAGLRPDASAGRDTRRENQAPAGVVDARLQRKVSFELKAAPFADFCEQLAKQTGVEIVASRSVADENITLF